MAIITFLSDYGPADHYVAAVKAKIIESDPSQPIVDISHHIDKFDITHAFYTLSNSFHLFPKKSVHMVDVNSHGRSLRHVALFYRDHFFVGPDNGLFSLFGDEVGSDAVELQSVGSKFPGRDIYAQVALSLAKGSKLNSLGDKIDGLVRMLNRQTRITKTMIGGQVVRVDDYGNLLTNISRDDFEKVRADRNFIISFGREKIDRINSSYESVEGGDCFVLFNSSGYLEIGINKGSAAQLLGLGFESPVNISFAG